MDIYRNTKTKEIVYKEDAEEYVLDTLGIKIIPKGIDNSYTKEQFEFILSTVEWFFSGDWYEDEIQEDEGNIFELINEECLYDEGRL